MAPGLRLRGYRQFQRAVRRAVPETRKYVREAFKTVGESIRREAARRFRPYHAASADYRVRANARGIAVYQPKRKTTGRRPDFGALQMRRALLPAAASEDKATERELERALDIVADHFER